MPICCIEADELQQVVGILSACREIETHRNDRLGW
ncbi:hypothetical protein PITC_082340 [Penicillium italicum]|uniref:Uncharacterized protein n=1 Tax=Penicillium italicum TaxID=40296 RepID=A0A0A2L5Z3_PENIT|nr:hypothetical protein PITC_082340 [Penicillium italicum]